jgi:hypothetical protein
MEHRWIRSAVLVHFPSPKPFIKKGLENLTRLGTTLADTGAAMAETIAMINGN